MRKVVLWGVPIRMHPTMPLMAALAVFFGVTRSTLIAALSLIAHEIAHITAAKALNLKVLELELMPFGGAARIEGLWSLRPRELLIVSLAGPACNLLILIVAAALGWWGALDVALAGAMIEVNLALMLFNLIPALPLDGGRVLCGLTGARLGPERAVRLGINAGRALGILLTLSAGAAYLAGGQVNIVLLLCAVYLIACAERERQSVSGAAVRSMVDRRSEMADEGAMPVRWLAVSMDAPIGEIARAMRPRYMHMLAVYDGTAFLGAADEKSLLAMLLSDPAAPAGALLGEGKRNRVAEMPGYGRGS